MEIYDGGGYIQDWHKECLGEGPTQFWDACSGHTELKPGLWPFPTEVLVLKPGVFLLVYQRKKMGEPGSVSARLTEVLGPSLSQDESSQHWRRSPLLQAILSWHHPSSSVVVTSDCCGWWQVGRLLTGLRAHQRGDERPISIVPSSFPLSSQDIQFRCSETDAKSTSRARHSTQAFNKRPQSPLWPQHGQRSHCCLCQIWPNFWWTDFQNGLVLIIYIY